jgi:hypothetical protein
MNRIRLSRILPALALGTLLMAPSAWAAPRKARMAGPTRAEGTWAVSLDFLSQLWSRAVHWVGKNGLGIDPHGTRDPRTMNGPSIDPDGRFPTGTKNGPGIDPHGGASGADSSSPNPLDGLCLLGPGGCGP